jgi:hypothetical protein
MLILILLLLYNEAPIVEEPFQVVERQTLCLNERNIKCFINGWTKLELETLQCFISNEENWMRKSGFLNIRKAKIHDWKELPTHYGKMFSGNRTLGKYVDKNVFYVTFDYRVYEENRSIINGLNYRVIGIVKENNEWKVAFEIVAPTQNLIEDGYGFETVDEANYFERRMKGN